MIRLELIGCVAGFFAGLLAGWLLWRPEPPMIEPAEPAIVLKDGGQVLERKPGAPVPDPITAAVKELGRGVRLERAVSITVQPKRTAPAAVPCPPLNLDLGIVRMPDDTRRVIARSPDSEIVGGMDIPIQPVTTPKTLKWAAGALYDPIHEDYGVFVDRDVGPFRIGVDVMRSQVDGDLTGVVRFGIRF